MATTANQTTAQSPNATIRDQAWHAILTVLTSTESFTIGDLERPVINGPYVNTESFPDEKRHSLRRVCDVTELYGYTRREKKGAHTRFAGDLSFNHDRYSDVYDDVSGRDEAWDAIFRAIVDGDQEITISSLRRRVIVRADVQYHPFDDGDYHTVRRVLRVAEAFGWLSRSSKYANARHPTPAAAAIRSLYQTG